MKIAKVLGTVVSTQKLDTMQGVKLLVVQFVAANGELEDHYEVAADRVGAGIDEWVLISRRAIAADPEGRERSPIDALVVGIIDTVSTQSGLTYRKKDEYRYLPQG